MAASHREQANFCGGLLMLYNSGIEAQIPDVKTRAL